MTSRPDLSRAYAKNRRDRLFQQRAAGLKACPRRHGRFGRCGGELVRLKRLGRPWIVCPKCERRRLGLCQDCDAPVAGRVGYGLRCATCKRRERRAAAARYRDRDPVRAARLRRAAWLRRRNDPVLHAHDLGMKKAWREKNQARIKMQKRKWRLLGRPGGYKDPARHRLYHIVYRARKTLMNGIHRAIEILERTLTRTKKRLPDNKHLQFEIEAIEAAIAQLRAVANQSTSPKQRRTA